MGKTDETGRTESPFVLSNERVGEDFYLMKLSAAGTRSARMGQFFMLRAWTRCPVLPRPISVFDHDGDEISFLYKVVGRGTEIFSALREGDSVSALGPLGSPFPEPETAGRVALVGGGVGIAPLYLAAKQLKALGSRVDVYLGFSGEPVLTEEYKRAADSVVVNAGGFITDEIDPSGYESIMTCGPEAMMRALYEKCKKTGSEEKLYVSLESRMACGVGACLVCSRGTVGGNKKVCKDGPVFKSTEVFGI